MSFEEKRRLLLRLDSLIRSKHKGQAEHLAKILNVSERTFYRLLNHLRSDLNAPVIYDAEVERYVYQKPGKTVIGFLPEEQQVHTLRCKV
jgi:predicted DNA-binding transcriptional regulator YafY